MADTIVSNGTVDEINDQLATGIYCAGLAKGSTSDRYDAVLRPHAPPPEINHEVWADVTSAEVEEELATASPPKEVLHITESWANNRVTVVLATIFPS